MAESVVSEPADHLAQELARPAQARGLRVATAPTAAAMARSAVQLLEADYAVALTGVGGPGPEEGQPAGTVYQATCAAGEEPDVVRRKFEGNPMAVLERSVLAALQELVDRITRG